MTLKEAIIIYLDLEKVEDLKREEIIKDLLEISIEKTLDLIMDEMSSEDLKKIGDFKKGSEKFQEINQGSLPQFFFDSLNNQLKEILYEFRTKSRGSIVEK